MTFFVSGAGLDNVCVKSEKNITIDRQSLSWLGMSGAMIEEYLEKETELDILKSKISRMETSSERMKLQRKYAPRKTMQSCSKIPIAILNPAVSEKIELKMNKNGYSFSGLNRCNSPFCDVCSKSIAMEGSERISLQLADRERSSFFVTFTIPRQDNIATARAEMLRRWGKLQEKIQYKFRTKRGLDVAFCRGLDVTFALDERAVYHLHIHAIIDIEGKVDDSEIQGLISDWLEQNNEIRAGRKGQLIERIQSHKKIGKYVAKMCGIGAELSNTRAKTGRMGSLSLSELIDVGCDDDNPLRSRAIAVYRSFIAGMKRARVLEFSRNWKKIEEAEETEEAEEAEDISLEIPDYWYLALGDMWLDIAPKIWEECIMNEDYDILVEFELLFEQNEYIEFCNLGKSERIEIYSRLRYIFLSSELFTMLFD